MRTVWKRRRDAAAVIGAAVADRHRLRARARRAPGAHAGAPHATGADRALAGRSRPRPEAASAARRWRRSTAELGDAAAGPGRPGAAARLLRRASRSSIAAGLLLAYHDRSDGGLLVTLLRDGLRGRHRARRSTSTRLGRRSAAVLFAEELGAVLQVRARGRRPRAPRLSRAHGLGGCVQRDRAAGARATGSSSARDGRALLDGARVELRGVWSETTLRACRRCATIPPAPTRSSSRACDASDPGLLARAHLRPGPGRWPRRFVRAAARGRASPSCASRASTARSRWRRPSTAPASRRSTCT